MSNGHTALPVQRHTRTGELRARCQCPGGTWVAPFRVTALETVEDLARHWRGDSAHGDFHPALCNVSWGSHGCDLPAGHAGTIHTCDSDSADEPCCQYDEAADPAHIRWPEQFNAAGNVAKWSPWRPHGEAFR